MEPRETVAIPYYVHEGEMSRMERVNKRLWLALLIIFLAFVGTNVGWIVYENQFVDVVTTDYSADAEDNGTAIINGEGSVTINGNGAGTDNENAR